MRGEPSGRTTYFRNQLAAVQQQEHGAKHAVNINAEHCKHMQWPLQQGVLLLDTYAR
jgi:hypothetical protein